MHPWAHMHHYGHHHWRGFRPRCGRPFLWFIVGAGVATFWHKSHEAREWQGRPCWRDRIPQDAYRAPGAPPFPVRNDDVSKSPSGGTPGDAVAQKRECDRRAWGWSWSTDNGYKSWGQPPQSPQVPQTPHIPPTPMPGPDPDVQRMQALGKQATDTISELSEATLDSVLATVQSLKTKLAENRAQREQHLQQMQALKEEQYKIFEEWKRQQEEHAKAQQPPPPRHIV